MRQRSGDDPLRGDRASRPPSEGPVLPEPDAGPDGFVDAVTRRGVMRRTGFVLGALAAAGGVTAWTLLDGPWRSAQQAGAAGSGTPSAAPAIPAGRYATPAATGGDSAPASPAGLNETDEPLPVHYFGPAGNQNVYFTMDDGWFPSRRVLEIMKSESIPVTTFLIVDAAREQLPFWRDFVAAGGRIENHTVSHPYLTRLPPGEAERQWAQTQVTFRNWFGSTPTLGRPPFGAINNSVSVAARNAGLTTMVAWSAADNTGTVKTWDRQKLSAGEISLSHWDPGVSTDFAQLVAAAGEGGLTAAYLPESW